MLALSALTTCPACQRTFPPALLACAVQITGRAVIFPRLMCGMDRWWAPHAGIIPGSGLELPYLCPADHVLDLES